MKSAPFPGANAKINFTPEQAERARERFEEVDARGRLYISQAEHAAMMREIGFVSDVCFGGNKVWLNPASPNLRAMFDFVMRFRTAAAIEDNGSIIDTLAAALKPFATMAEHFPLEGGYGNRPRTGPIYQVSSGGKPDAEFTVEDLHAARDAIALAHPLPSKD